MWAAADQAHKRLLTHATSQGKDQKSEFEAWFLLNVSRLSYHRKIENSKVKTPSDEECL